MKTIDLLRRFKLSDVAKSSFKIDDIKSSIVKIRNYEKGKYKPIYIKIFKIDSVPDFHKLPQIEQENWNNKVEKLIGSLPTSTHLSFRTVNYISKTKFWQIQKNLFTKGLQRNASTIRDLGKTPEHFMQLFEELKDFSMTEVYDPFTLEIRREYYITIPYYLYKPFEGKIDKEKLNRTQKNLSKFCELNDLKPFYEEYYKESKGVIHNFEQENLMKNFFIEVEKKIKEFSPKYKILEDEELATYYNSKRHGHSIYTNLNGKDLFLRIHDLIQIAGEYRPEFNRLHEFFPNIQRVKQNYLNFNEEYMSIISIFRMPDYLTENQLGFITEEEGDFDFHTDFVPIETGNLIENFNENIENINSEIEYQNLTFDEVSEELIYNLNREKLIRNYLSNQEIFKFKGYILVRGNSLDNLNNQTSYLINKLNSKGFWAKRISSEYLLEDYRSVSNLGVDCGKSGWQTTLSSISYSLNFLNHDFDLPSSQGRIIDMDEVNSQLNLQEEMRAERSKKND